MKIKKLEIDGFRCLCGLDISFEEDLTVLVGENDAGKSSLVDCLKVITQNQPLELDDFNYDKDIIRMSVCRCTKCRMPSARDALKSRH